MSTQPATAILFPGQGSHTDDMRDTVARERPDLLERVTEAVGEDPFPRASEGTGYAQPAIFAASLAGWHALGRPLGSLMAGHSLGSSPRWSPRGRWPNPTASGWSRCAGG